MEPVHSSATLYTEDSGDLIRRLDRALRDCPNSKLRHFRVHNLHDPPAISADDPENSGICLTIKPSQNRPSTTMRLWPKDWPGLAYVPAFLAPREQQALYYETMGLDTRPPNRNNLAPTTGSICVAPSGEPAEGLRWITLGRQYLWETRSFAPETVELRPQLAALAQEAVGAVSASTKGTEYHSDWYEVYHADTYTPNTGIVNIYRGADRLRGHRDDVDGELADFPLVSISLGVAAIFCITDGTKQLALNLRSGDLLILGGKSRTAVHSVPRLYDYQKTGRRLELKNNDNFSQRDVLEAWTAFRRLWKMPASAAATGLETEVDTVQGIERYYWENSIRVNISLRQCGVSSL